MSGPIVRSGASPEFSKNWDNVFGGKNKGAKAAKPAAKSAKAKSAKAKSPAKAVKKAVKKKK